MADDPDAPAAEAAEVVDDAADAPSVHADEESAAAVVDAEDGADAAVEEDLDLEEPLAPAAAPSAGPEEPAASPAPSEALPPEEALANDEIADQIAETIDDAVSGVPAPAPVAAPVAATAPAFAPSEAPSMAPAVGAPSSGLASTSPAAAMPGPTSPTPPKPKPPKKAAARPAGADQKSLPAKAEPDAAELEAAALAKRVAGEKRQAAFKAAQKREAAERAAERAAADALAAAAEEEMSSTFVGRSIPAWKRRLVHERAQANKAEAAVVTQQKQRLQQAADRLAQLKARAQREKAHVGIVAAMRREKERKRQAVREVVELGERLTGRDVVARLRDEPPPDDGEVLRLSRLFNQALFDHFRPEERTFYRLFKTMDLDGSTRISFSELEALARGPLRLGQRELPPNELGVLWRALDANDSGFIDAGELSRFMRRGQIKTLTPAQVAKARMLARKEREAAAVQAETDALHEREVVERAAAVERASAEEVRELGDLCAHRLASAGPYGVVNAISLFKLADRDGSGLITYAEFKKLVRVELRLDEGAIADGKLLGLWRAIDENENGFICAGEFQRFMRGSLASDARLNEIDGRRIERARERDAEAIRRSGAYSKALAKETEGLARELEEEAARLESLLAKGSRAQATAAAAAVTDAPPNPPEPRRRQGGLPKSKSMPVQLVLPVLDRGSAPQKAMDGVANDASRAARRRIQTPNTRLVAEALQDLAREMHAPKPRRARVGAAGEGKPEITKEMAMAAYTTSLPVLGAGARRRV